MVPGVGGGGVWQGETFLGYTISNFTYNLSPRDFPNKLEVSVNGNFINLDLEL